MALSGSQFSLKIPSQIYDSVVNADLFTFCNGAALQQMTVSQRFAIAKNFLLRGTSNANAKVFPSIIKERGGLAILLSSDERLCVGDIVKFCQAVSSLSLI